MGSKGLENATSLERYLNRNVLFVQGIESNVPKSEVVQVLSHVCKQPQQGRIDILTTPDGKMRGTAFLNFHNRDDAKAALDKWRFSLELRGRPLRMQFSSDREFKEVIQGPMVARFKILVRNLPEELDAENLFIKFSEFGEILQVHCASDHHGQYYAIIQYVDTASVQQAIRATNREKVFNHVLMVEVYKPSINFGVLPRSITHPGSAAANGAAASSSSSAARGPGGGIPAMQGMTYAALQRQEELEAALLASSQEGGGTSAGGGHGEQTSEGGAGAAGGSEAGGEAQAGGGGVSMSLQVPSFYAPAVGVGAPGAAQGLAASAGSLHSLLATALHHVHMLDELLCCPITQEPLVDPVVAADGNTYERLAIQAWLENHDTSPLTNQVLPHKSLTPNNLIRKIAEELKGTAGDGGAESAAAAAANGVADAVPAAADPAAAPVAAADPEPLSVPVPVPIPAGSHVIHYETLHAQQEAAQQQQLEQQQQLAAQYYTTAQQPVEAAPQQQQHQSQQQQFGGGGLRHHHQQQHFQQHQAQTHFVVQAMQQPMIQVQMPIQQQMQQIRGQAQQPYAFNPNAQPFYAFRHM